tara:strand:- start:40 stop:414 length:375 start_codon:yes stop_codon:yes gene_type:complete
MTNYLLGLQNEIKIKPIIEKFFNIELSHGNRYDTFDFYNDDNYVELKCRNCYSYSYNDLMMNLNKWKEGYTHIKFNKNIYYVFKFKDGIYYYKQNLIDKFQIKEYNNKEYIYILTDKLLKITNK